MRQSLVVRTRKMYLLQEETSGKGGKAEPNAELKGKENNHRRQKQKKSHEL